MELTREQQAAVDSRNENLLLAAAAGSGKTRTLTERVISLLEDRACKIDELLIVTFTNAAAQEMRSRIQDALEKHIEAELDNVNREYFEEQLLFLEDTQISTFHSFCQDILRKYFSYIDIDPEFRTANERELDIIKRRVIKKMFERDYKVGDFNKFVEEFGGSAKGDEKIYETVIDLHNFSMSMPYPDAWLDSLAEFYDLPENARLEDTVWFNFLKPQIFAALERIFDDCAEARRLAEENQIILGTTESDSRQITPIRNAGGNWDKIFDAIWAVDFEDFDKRRKFTPEQRVVRDRIKFLRDDYKQRLLNLREKYFIADEKSMVSDLRGLHASVCELARVTKDFSAKFSAAKRKNRIIDFADMEHLALKIFDDAPEVIEEERHRFKFIMVDEYQDTNGVQEAIIQKITRKDDLFFVGDVKQSIYRFRLIDSANFKDKMTNDNYRCINLSKNFRSRKQIIAAINEIFKRLMNCRVTEIDYDAAAQLQFGAQYKTGEEYFDERPEFYLIKSEKVDDDDSKSIEVEMRFIAYKIHSLIASGKLVRDGNDYRPVGFGDIVILHRSPKNQASEIIDTLQSFNVPAYLSDEENFFRSTEIEVVLSLLNVLYNARQDMPLATVMLSSIGGFSMEEITQLLNAAPDEDLYGAVQLGGEKCQNFLTKLNHWREEAKQNAVPELLSKLYYETGYYDAIGTEKGGRARQANLQVLIARAAEWYESEYYSLSKFLRLIKKIRESGKDMAKGVPLMQNAVRVITVHKSKGMEYPVVFVAGMGKSFNKDDSNKGIVLKHRDFGIGLHRTPEDTRIKIKTLAMAAISKRIADEALAEELRILYVALTRAQEKLFLVGIISQKKLDNTKQVDVPTDYEILTAGKFTDWLFPIKDALEPVIESKIIGTSDVLAIEDQHFHGLENKKSRPLEKIPNTSFAGVPAKLSVTELKRRVEEEEFPQLEDFVQKKSADRFQPPKSMHTGKLSGAEFGSLMHKVMQSLDLNGDLSEEGVVAQVEDLARRNVIPPEHAKLVKTTEIAKFFASEIGQRLIAAQEVHRELPFSRLIDAQRFFRVDDKIFIQGIIDLLFKDSAGRWILIDYKTDRDTSDIAERYRVQIELYAQAVEDLLEVSVDEKYLYLLGSARLIKMQEV